MALDLQLRAVFAQSIRDAEESSEAGGDPSHKVLLAEKGRKGVGFAFKLLKQARHQVSLYTPALFNPERSQYVPSCDMTG